MCGSLTSHRFDSSRRSSVPVSGRFVNISKPKPGFSLAILAAAELGRTADRLRSKEFGRRRKCLTELCEPYFRATGTQRWRELQRAAVSS